MQTVRHDLACGSTQIPPKLNVKIETPVVQKSTCGYIAGKQRAAVRFSLPVWLLTHLPMYN